MNVRIIDFLIITRYDKRKSWRKMNKNRNNYWSLKWIWTINYTRTRKKDYLVIATMRNLEKQGTLLSQVTQQLTAKYKSSTIRCNRSKFYT